MYALHTLPLGLSTNSLPYGVAAWMTLIGFGAANIDNQRARLCGKGRHRRNKRGGIETLRSWMA